MIYYKYKKGVQFMDSDGAYFMPDNLYFSTALLLNGMYSSEVNLINQLKDEYKNIGKDKTFIDVGANVGTYTMILGQIFKKTYSFEPNRHIYNILCGNIALYNLSDKTELYRIGLSDKSEVLTYNYFDALGGNNMFVKEKGSITELLSHKYDDSYLPNRHSEELLVKTLDEFNIEDVGLIKIDVEGFELNVLKGGVKTIVSNHYPKIIIESWNVEDTDTEDIKQSKITLRKELKGYLESLGYSFENFTQDVFVCNHA